MTTLVGLVAGKGKPGVVLASDITGTRTDWEGQGDVRFKRYTKNQVKKIHVNDDRNLAVCMSGLVDVGYNEFLYSLLHGEIDFRKAIKRGHFEELFKLNCKRCKGKHFDSEKQSGLLIATRYRNTPQLYSCFPLGKVEEEKQGDVLGSGGEHVIKYLQDLNGLCPSAISIQKAVMIGSNALERASTDMYTGGLDLVVVTEKEIIEYGELIRSNLEKAKQASLHQIIKKFQK